jgi:2-C-methyl-D-erythritol 4-phosphate cytidylyltransferase
VSDERLRVAVVLLAAGRGSRLSKRGGRVSKRGSRVGQDVSKAFLPLAGRPMLSWSLAQATQVASVTQVLVIVAEHDQELAQRLLAQEQHVVPARTVVGGRTRHESEWRALEELAPDIHAGRLDIVVIHDAARPMAGSQLFEDVISGADRHGGALPGRPATALIRTETSQPVPASDVMAVQTPQAFRAGALLKAYELADVAGFTGTDTASTVERFSDLEVHCLVGPAQNIKITFPDDLRLAEQLLAWPVQEARD